MCVYTRVYMHMLGHACGGQMTACGIYSLPPLYTGSWDRLQVDMVVRQALLPTPPALILIFNPIHFAMFTLG